MTHSNLAPFPIPYPSQAPLSSSLLLQLILKEILKAGLACRNPQKTDSLLMPYGWIYPVGSIPRIYGYMQELLPLFPRLRSRKKTLQKTLFALYSLIDSSHPNRMHKQLQVLWNLLEPFLKEHKYNENLFLFLLKNRMGIGLFMKNSSYLYDFLVQIYPEGLEVVGEKLCDRYHRRGFFSQISECKLLLTQLIDARSTT